jgi:hypothetical protein
MKYRKWPKTMFIEVREENTTNEYFDVTPNMNELGEFGETTKVGVYRFVEEKRAINKTEIVKK